MPQTKKALKPRRKVAKKPQPKAVVRPLGLCHPPLSKEAYEKIVALLADENAPKFKGKKLPERDASWLLGEKD